MKQHFKLRLWTLFFAVVTLMGCTGLYRAETSQGQAQSFIVLLAGLSFLLLMLLWSL
ncbi:MAG: hypothetical protein KDA84_22785 [Planctomycetaceae bacterium]|nr:hypothetical protein [Planctomycetaceae bacterium]